MEPTNANVKKALWEPTALNRRRGRRMVSIKGVVVSGCMERMMSCMHGAVALKSSEGFECCLENLFIALMRRIFTLETREALRNRS